MIALFVAATLSCLTDYDCGYVGQCDWFGCKCPEGVSGISCEINPCGIHRDPREKQPILHGSAYKTVECSLAGKCVNDNGAYKCVCEEGFSGDTCEMKICTSPADCNGQRCDTETGVCACEFGFNKGDCSVATCKPVYNLVTMEYQYCRGKGTCTKAPDISGKLPPVRYYCDCNKGFSGHTCEDYDCTDGLLVCTNDKHICDYSTKKCMCKPHHYGPDCSRNPCAITYGIGNHITGQCNGHGTCSDDGPDNAKCGCEQGWVGSDCSIEDCTTKSSVCSTPLQCDNTLHMCVCPNNKIGKNCDSCRIGEYFAKEANECTPYNCISDVPKGIVCSGHGTCNRITNKCDCSTDMVAIGIQHCVPKSCVTATQSNPQEYSLKNVCSGRGTCELSGSSYVCKCLTNYTGTLCEKNPCKILKYTSTGAPVQKTYIECNGGGTCENESCHCRPGYTGVSCDIFSCNGMDSLCNGGRCVQDSSGGWKCNCPEGSDLADCSRKSCGSSTSLCSGNGVCALREFTSTDDDGTVRKLSLHRCICALRYKGLHCERYDCEGDNANCNGGTCSESGECTTCLEHFYGRDCRINPCGIDYVQKTECSGHGVCQKTTNSAGEETSVCVCNQDWFGSICDKQTCPTASCRNGGKCIETSNGNYCKCAGGFSGILCQDCVHPFKIVFINGVAECVPGSCVGDEGYCSGHGHCTSEQESCLCDYGYTTVGTDRCIPDSCVYEHDGIITVCGLKGSCAVTERGAECLCSEDNSRRDSSSGFCMPINCFSSPSSNSVCNGHGFCNIMFDTSEGVCICNNGFTNDSGTCTLNAKAAAGIGVSVAVLVAVVIFIILWFTVIKKKLEERKRNRFDGDSVRLINDGGDVTSYI